ncbi:FtsX-like permease family protein [Streptomyces aidingensis]|uniref:Putative ABC transport system permease protein n=1 Tax=Streptomyces aidingensis TaxID=910347 RepID=A0A1I1K7S8_9ACTN|nr:FtsX-like permease family protein [Streptomyces aidingensis]SFC53580.1 putative ABC transport system permease protein [Streptomyces aidingensis]
MRGWHTWRAALRIARRDALRAKGRSALVVAMLALPIIGVSGADLMVRSGQLDTGERLTRLIGAADAAYRDEAEGRPLYQSPEADQVYWREGDDATSAGAGPADGEPVPLEEVLPDGARAITERTVWGLDVQTEAGIGFTALRELAVSDPLAEGLLTLRGGSWPDAEGEVAATEAFLAESGYRIGSELTLPDLDVTLVVTGAYEIPGALGDSELLTVPDAGLLGPGTQYLGWDHGTRYLVSRPGGVSWDEVMAANDSGWVVVSRQVVTDPPPRAEVPLYAQQLDYRDGGVDGEVAAVLVTVVALVITEICLLAGPAFAVGARSSRRMLGLVGANGGDRGQIRAIMLASGVVLGLVAAVAGIAIATVGTLLLRPWLEEQTGARFGSFDFRPLEMLAIAGLAVMTGVIAALIPAVTAARTPVLESLTGRRGVRRAGRVLPVAGGAAFLLGSGVAVVGGLQFDSTSVVGGGAVVAELGLVAMTPVLVGLFGRVSRRLPLSGRLALRDAVRNRSRTAPAVAAVLAAVAGSVAVATSVAGDEEQNRADYSARLPHGVVAVEAVEAYHADLLDGTRAAAEDTLPVDRRVDVRRIQPGPENCGLWSGSGPGCGYLEVLTPPENECDYEKFEADLAAARAAGELPEELDWRCADASGSHMSALEASVVVAGPDLLELLGVTDQRAVSALEAGRAVVFRRALVDGDGRFRLGLYDEDPYLESDQWPDEDTLPEPDRQVAFPAQVAQGLTDDDGVPMSIGLDAVIPASAAEAEDLRLVDYASLYTTTHLPDSAEQQQFNAALKEADGGAWVYIERGYTGDQGLVLLVLTLVAGAITIGAAGIATGLAQADSEADLATLAAVGAPPRVRRTLSGLQCAVIAAMGVVLGTLSGIVPGIGLRMAVYRQHQEWYEPLYDPFGTDAPQLFVAVPWGTIGQLLIVVPLVAGVLAALLTRSRVGLTRRAG